jgi:hypothetical protein
MPTYALPDGNITIDGITLEQVRPASARPC